MLILAACSAWRSRPPCSERRRARQRGRQALHQRRRTCVRCVTGATASCRSARRAVYASSTPLTSLLSRSLHCRLSRSSAARAPEPASWASSCIRPGPGGPAVHYHRAVTSRSAERIWRRLSACDCAPDLRGFEEALSSCSRRWLSRGVLTGPAHVHRAPLRHLHSHPCVYGANSHTGQQTHGPCLSRHLQATAARERGHTDTLGAATHGTLDCSPGSPRFPDLQTDHALAQTTHWTDRPDSHLPATVALKPAVVGGVHAAEVARVDGLVHQRARAVLHVHRRQVERRHALRPTPATASARPRGSRAAHAAVA